MSSSKDRRASIDLYKRQLNYVRPYWKYIAIAMILALAVSAADGGIAWLVKPALDKIFGQKDMTLLRLVSLALLILGCIKGFSLFFQNYLMRRVGHRVVTDLRQELYNHLQKMSLSFFHNTPSAVLMSRMTNDVSRLVDISSEVIADFFRQVFTAIALTGVAFYQEWRLAATYMLISPFIFFPIKKVGKRIRKLSRKDQEKLAEINTVLQETFTGNKIVKAFSMEDYERERFARENDKLYQLKLKGTVADEILTPIMEGLGIMGVALVIWYGGYRVIMGYSTTGTFFSFIVATGMLFQPIRKLAKMSNKFNESMAATERVFELLDVKPQIVNSPNALELPPFNQHIEYHQVHFNYGNGVPVLKDINVKIAKGQTVALVGLSGAGKTTLADLLCRFYDVCGGKITIDDKDLREITVESLRRQIGIVTQETILFNDTVANNIGYGRKNATREEIIEAAKAAYAHDFIMQMPEQYESVIGERGVKLSGGQRKRLTIARAVLKNPAILILDEATSELDSESEKLVHQALENLMQGRTTIAIAHRLSTIHNADQILVLEDGQIVERGNHQSLMDEGGVYSRLYSLQYKGQKQGEAAISL